MQIEICSISSDKCRLKCDIWLYQTTISFRIFYKMTSAIKRGALIVFEGCDRSGKTTQVTRLVERLNNANRSVSYNQFSALYM